MRVASSISAACRVAGSPRCSTIARPTRPSAHERFTAVGRAPPIRAAASRTFLPTSNRSVSVPSRASVTPIAATMPMAGAPRTASVRMALYTSSTVRRSRYSSRSGRFRWSRMRTPWPSADHATGWITSIRETYCCCRGFLRRSGKCRSRNPIRARSSGECACPRLRADRRVRGSGIVSPSSR